MTPVTLTINGCNYDVVCAPDQAERILFLGQNLADRARSVLQQVRPVSDTRLLLMIALTLADELDEAHSQVKSLPDQDASRNERLTRLVERVEFLASRAEKS